MSNKPEKNSELIPHALKSYLARIACCLFVLVMATSCTTWREVTAPPVLKGIVIDGYKNRALFDERIKEKFPVGTAQEYLISELRKQGFEYHDAIDHRAPWFSYQTTDLSCKTTWTISWKIDSNNKISDIETGVRWPCL